MTTNSAVDSSIARLRVLVVDDDQDIVELLTFALGREQMHCLAAHDANTALRVFHEQQPDLIVLDVKLGGPSGLDVLTALRQQSQVPVILLTAFDSQEDKVRGLRMGADDYLTKPFYYRELIERINAVMRRSRHDGPPRRPLDTLLKVGPITLNVADHSVTVAGQPVNLALMEFRLLHCLMENAGRVVTTSKLLKQVWGYQDLPTGNEVVRVTVWRLRRKLERDPQQPQLLHNIAGVGWLLKAEPAPD